MENIVKFPHELLLHRFWSYLEEKGYEVYVRVDLGFVQVSGQLQDLRIFGYATDQEKMEEFKSQEKIIQAVQRRPVNQIRAGRIDLVAVKDSMFYGFELETFNEVKEGIEKDRFCSRLARFAASGYLDYLYLVTEDPSMYGYSVDDVIEGVADYIYRKLESKKPFDYLERRIKYQYLIEDLEPFKLGIILTTRENHSHAVQEPTKLKRRKQLRLRENIKARVIHTLFKHFTQKGYEIAFNVWHKPTRWDRISYKIDMVLTSKDGKECIGIEAKGSISEVEVEDLEHKLDWIKRRLDLTKIYLALPKSKYMAKVFSLSRKLSKELGLLLVDSKGIEVVREAKELR